MKVLIIGYVWPEPQSSAAGVRDWGLIQVFQRAGWQVHFASGSAENTFTQTLIRAGVQTHSIRANDSSFDHWISQLKPDFVFFDRFVTEEQFGWRVRENSPESVRILDTQDLHFLRRAREEVVREADLEGPCPLVQVERCEFELVTESALREIASIFRSDLTLILSDFEMNLLIDRFSVPGELLELAPICYPSFTQAPGFGERRDFMMIGNFRHSPNTDGVRWLRREIWPEIRKNLSDAQIHVYGSYPSKEMMSLSEAAQGFSVKGLAPDQYAVLREHRVNLAPLRFGAGIKGKVLDGWWSGTPCVMTAMGAEGLGWDGVVARSAKELAERAVELYTNENAWSSAQKRGYELLQGRFDLKRGSETLLKALDLARSQLTDRRLRNFTGAMLWHHQHKSTTYFSKWIEEKKKVAENTEGETALSPRNIEVAVSAPDVGSAASTGWSPKSVVGQKTSVFLNG